MGKEHIDSEKECLVDLDSKRYIYIDNEDDEIIERLCEAIFRSVVLDNISEPEEIEDRVEEDKQGDFDVPFSGSIIDSETVKKHTESLATLLKNIKRPYMIIQESHYIDSGFRDRYYSYYSNQHFDMHRYSRRLSFFYLSEEFTEDIKNNIDEYFIKSDSKWNKKYGKEEDSSFEDIFSKNIIGTCVIDPLITGLIGRTLINPRYLKNTIRGKAYIITSEYKVHIKGREFNITAFPYRMQDNETMTCAEVTIANIIDYYSNKYNEYRTVTPTEILDCEQRHGYERSFPSRGMTYPELSRTLAEFGFYPRLYYKPVFSSFRYSYISKEMEIKRLMHYYIESGIPVALNLGPDKESEKEGHSIVCIGHSEKKKNYLEDSKKFAGKISKSVFLDKDGINLINSADFYENYIIMDDNQIPYKNRSYEKFSIYPNYKIDSIAVPLNRRMFLDASDAYAIITSILENENTGIAVWTDGKIGNNDYVIMRIFMTSSSGLKEFRIHTEKYSDRRGIYEMVDMPRFVWVCELYEIDKYEENQAFAEIIVDATGARDDMKNSYSSLIMMRYPKLIGFRMYSDIEPGLRWQYSYSDKSYLTGYYGHNLNMFKEF